MKTLFIACLALLLFACSKHSPVSPDQPCPDLSGLLCVTVTRPAPPAPLSKQADMSRARLEIIVTCGDETVDTAFPLSSASTLTRLVKNVPQGKNAGITANIFSVDDSLTHTGSAFADVLAGETTFVEIQTQSRFGYLSLTIDDVPSNVDSGYARISGSGMADLFAPLLIDSLARDTAVEYDGHAFALIEYVPIGQNRSLQVFLLKDNGQVAYQGGLTIAIQPDSNRIGKIVLDPASAKLRVSVVEPDFDTASVVGSILAVGKPETGRLIISEIMYNSYGTDNNEWIELYNTSPDSVDLSLFRLIVLRDTLVLSGGLAPGGFFVIGESDSSYVDLKTGAFNIPNSGDSTFLIVDDTASPDSVSDRVFIRYAASENWPASTDGASIELKKSYLDALSNNYGLFWVKAATLIPGSASDKGSPGK